MLERLTIRGAAPPEPGLDHASLYAAGIEHVRLLSRRIWTDHNTHDPGITTLELLCYALTDLSYRASFPIEDVLSSADGAAAMAGQFFSARTILPNQPLTVLDYRKLLIDLPGVRNAFVEPAPQELYADIVAGKLVSTPPAHPNVREVTVRGIYSVRLDLTDDGLKDASSKAAVLDRVRECLAAHRCVGEDFLEPVVIEPQVFALCGNLDLAPNADVVEVFAQVRLRVQAYLSPTVPNYTLSEMLGRPKPDGSLYTVAEVFDGPTLQTGFIDDEELKQAELRTDIRLSDVIQILMGIDGVRAVRDLLVVPATQNTALPNKWLVKVEDGKRPTLDDNSLRLIAHKRGVPIPPSALDVKTRYQALNLASAQKNEVVLPDTGLDLPVPVGRERSTGSYHSFQNHFPAIYGLGPDGAPSGADDRRKALAYQLKAYLLFFDQIMADYLAQLQRVKDLFSNDPTLKQTYFQQAVTSFAAWERIYARSDLGAGDTNAADVMTVLAQQSLKIASDDAHVERRNRFLDHLIARFAERFHDYAAVTKASLGATAEGLISVKCAFLQQYPTLSADRGLAYNASLLEDGKIWDTQENVSGLEKRLAALLGMPAAERHNLSGGTSEGMFLIENLLLRNGMFDDPLLPICADPSCADCADDDPYSYRIHVILPAYAGRFVQQDAQGNPRPNMELRSFAEDVIREETPAHILPKICWVDQDTMGSIEVAYKAWLLARAAGSGVAAALKTLVDVLWQARSVYPEGRLHGCEPGAETAKFQLGRTKLGSQKSAGPSGGGRNNVG